ncbi:MAG: dynamin family protein [Anaerolineales bacterium]|nr:dynamin family protein [Anaerolineales bacterium]
MSILRLLNEHQSAIWQRERDLIQRLLHVFDSWEIETSDSEHLSQALDQLNELFLLVVVGEFNSGKSALINALLGETYLTEGVTPTTDRIYIVKHGEPGNPEFIRENVRVVRYPAEILREVHIVDTPGTNAVLRHHEAIVRDFVPRSDMVIFVTSADRPFTESERDFLENIRKWGKKVVVIINKIDILQNAEAIDEVVSFVSNQVQRLLDFEPELFQLSARAAQQMNADDSSSKHAEAFLRFQEYLQDTLSKESIIKLKLRNPLGVSLKIARQYKDLAQKRVDVLADDSATLQKVQKQLELFENDTQAEFGRHLDRIEKELLSMRVRGEEFLDDRLRLLKIRDMLNSKKMRAAFESEVVGDSPQRIENHVEEIIDWLVERELRQWRLMADELGRRKETEALRDAAKQAASGFAYNRRQLLNSVGTKADQVIASFDQKAEASRLTETIRESVALVGLVEVGAISLGLILKAVLTTAAADATGLLAAGVLGVLGLAVIPYRRGRAKREFRKKMTQLQDSLRGVLSDDFKRELEHSVGRLREAIAPYRRFILNEEDQLKNVLSELKNAEVELQSLEEEIEH